MVYFELRKRNGDTVTYDYMPEKESADRGVVSLNLITGKRETVRKSTDDRGFNYAEHALRAIGENFSASGSIDKKAGPLGISYVSFGAVAFWLAIKRSC